MGGETCYVDQGTLFSSAEASFRFRAKCVSAKKDEDRWIVEQQGLPGVCDHAVGVFDGHNGKPASRYVSENIVGMLKRELEVLGVDFSVLLSGTKEETEPRIKEVWANQLDTALKNTFQRLDTTVKQQTDSGTTATLLLFRRGAGTDLEVKVAWVGDSAASLYTPGEAKGTRVTIDHRVTTEYEQQRVIDFYDQRGGGTRLVNGDRRLYAQATADVEPSTKVEHVHVQEVLSIPQPVVENTNKTEFQKKVAESEAVSFVGVYVDGDGNKLSDNKRLFAKNGSSYGVTRSIGDIEGARALICEPEIKNLTISSSSWFLIASDGLWDAIPMEKAHKLLKTTKDLEQAEKKLFFEVDKARKFYSLSADDTTIVLLDYSVGGDKAEAGMPNAKSSSCCIN
mmetsp:Transcript_37497/g.45267  ORF Transcript_37497/g.45267 Transcript_37497/m.45267 type:complete len:396 (-) Transcript_37497:564-1751(-)|eukprot:CAMPEP_0197849014 /NCGR_PEP_ID=MMETSP1438-20131217/10593_1 /TAXON_ID=1461541 /ORGANISM="Pterosperma sp., Strain CCMP1384" /LENGTH=395 /DNA_ID=CAMNT_0043461509 /DNA_START=458 /DNA_END=1645 /DNA_ORIENTATION=-